MTVMKKIAYSIKDLSEVGLGSESHIRRLIKEDKIPAIRLGKRELIPAYWVDEYFLKPVKVD